VKVETPKYAKGDFLSMLIQTPFLCYLSEGSCPKSIKTFGLLNINKHIFENCTLIIGLF
jgi:hypothetical protein